MPASESVLSVGRPASYGEPDMVSSSIPAEPELVDEDLAAPDELRATLPRLHRAAYEGDLAGVLECIVDPLALHDTVRVRNQAGKVVCGITPLFLAAQRGHTKVIKLLITQGANPAQPAYIEGTDDLCTPAQVARLNFHFLTARYVNQAVAARKQGDKLLKKEEKILVAANPDATDMQHQAIVNLGDLTHWDPVNGHTPIVQKKGFVRQIFGNKGDKLDLRSWKPDAGPVKRVKDVAPSQSRVADERELLELDADHTGTLDAFLGDAPSGSWDGQDHVENVRGGAGAASSVAATHEASQGIGGGDDALLGASSGRLRGMPSAGLPRGAARSNAAAAKAAAASQRWYAHGDSDSNSEDGEDNVEASMSLPAPPGTRF